MAASASPTSPRITWKEHARIGIPVTLLTLFVAAVWLAVTSR